MPTILPLHAVHGWWARHDFTAYRYLNRVVETSIQDRRHEDAETLLSLEMEIRSNVRSIAMPSFQQANR